MLKYSWQWLVGAAIFMLVGLYFNKPDFEIAIISIVCLATGSIIAAIRDIR